MKTQVAIIGAGPAGLLLAEILHRHGVASVVLEKSSRAQVLSRIRAGVLEQTTVDVLRANGLADRMDRDDQVHNGTRIVWAGRESYFIDIVRHTGKHFMIYGQTRIPEDLFAAADRRQAMVLTEVDDVQLLDIGSNRPTVTYRHQEQSQRLECDFIAGCDGFHGVSRLAIPAAVRREFEKVYPFACLAGCPVGNAAFARNRLRQPPARFFAGAD